ncbi:MAG: FlgD immunoglobulin-like domain containing protein, partial [Candidatus Eisenbacteria bacterium]
LHFNHAIIDAPPNAAVPMVIAQAIHDASDHLPLFADFQVPARIVTQDALALGPVFVGGNATDLLSVENPAAVPGDDLDYSFTAPSAFDAPAGDFSLPAGAAPALHPISLHTDAAGFFAGNLVVHSDAPDEPSRNVELTGTVLDHARPSLDAAQVITEGTLDFGTHPVGQFAPLDALVYNFGYQSLQGLLDVYDAQITGDVRFSIAGGFTPQTLGTDPGTWSIEFDDAGASDGTYDATLVFSTRDQQDLGGALDLADLTLQLTATVGDAASVPTDPTHVVVAGIASIHPNPFSPSAEIHFGLTESGPVRLAVYDAGGRLLRSLASGDLPAGEHAVRWDGTDDAGRSMPAGIYFLRLQSRRLDQTRHIVRIR